MQCVRGMRLRGTVARARPGRQPSADREARRGWRPPSWGSPSALRGDQTDRQPRLGGERGGPQRTQLPPLEVATKLALNVAADRYFAQALNESMFLTLRCNAQKL